MPDEDQWWITGFNPYVTEPNPEKMVMVSSIDFSGQFGMYQEFKNSYEPSEYLNIIFDDKLEMVWMLW